ncbi:MAG TPA: undecaprenyl-diphosphate phosphatase [Bacteroidia bacterium]|nr:undecaprenyl-diphosphate phosphatase [Bacteroidia bacterium]
MTFFQSIILAIIEGLTEFLPVSSTGHMILAGSIMDIKDREFTKTFEIVIQLGAILAVLALYWKRFFISIDIYLKLFVAFLPTGLIGFFAYKTIKEYLFNPITVSTSLIIGGVVLILLDRWTEKKESRYQSLEKISFRDAAMIGLFQCISMIPGVSRAAATIFGGIYSGFDRRQAAEFSFLLAIPTMLAASGWDLIQTHDSIRADDISMILTGAGVAFVVALLAVKGFVAFLNNHGFKSFGYYRIILGVVFLLYAYYAGLQLPQ